ncbi:MAG: pyridoxine 5'-phosphate synthase [Gammaproteobacteria bacterium]|nr:pyridoxine 5'-phosphate synthase [Gammaproteobacteria bacterium]
MVTALSVNLNKIAWLRNARGGNRPDVSEAARGIIDAGAQGITVHPRPDQRHIHPRDVRELALLLRSEHPGIEFNIEGNPAARARRNGYPGFDRLIEEARPHQATLVPDADSQLTSDHGWDLSDSRAAMRVAETIARYQGWGARVSLFMDPDERQIQRARACGADRIELYTGPYAELVERHGLSDARVRSCRRTYRDAARYAVEMGLGVNAGHDLNLDNLADFIAIGNIDEVSIGHALISDALDFGLAATVRKYLDAIAAAGGTA